MKPSMVLTIASPTPNYWVVRISPEQGYGIVQEIPCHGMREAICLARALSLNSPVFYPFKG